jgi:hypothetical protein
LSRNDRHRLAVFLANLAAYPFTNDLKLDWWESLRSPGAIPAFADCTQVLIAPSIHDDAWSRFAPPDDDVKLLHVIPVTRTEHHVLQDHGRESFLEFVEERGVDIFAPRADQGPAAST